MADGTISFVDGLGIKGIDSHEIQRKNRASAFTPQNLTPNQACGSKWVYHQPFSVKGGHDEDKNALKSALAYDVVKDEWI
ncbi:hypothetical protein RHMOL_Rhmol12G0230800 [Rhododendron molle]|uniref:Uncharacterized protein n=1 Tax=Rhododendron molle TaxID=49168 RepID=A0ACC0LMA7_RHOML|nr:hypothetical protein RHMOL_Rhmol12G0230800 [Rhododendron molle]